MAIRDKLESYHYGKGAEEQETVPHTDGSMRFASLHHHTTLSYLDGFGLPSEHMARAAELGYKAMAFTEHGNVSSHIKGEEMVEDTGVKAIFGCELYAGEVHPDRRTQRKNHLTVLAEDAAGYRNLLSVVSKSWSDGFHYYPTTSGELLGNHAQGLFVLSGCTASLLATSLIGGKNVDSADASYARARRVAQKMKDCFGDHFFLEVQMFPELEETRAINPAYERMSQELGIPLVATADVHYPYPHQNDMQKILHNVRGGSRQSLEQQEADFEYSIKLTHPTSDKAAYKKLRATGLSKQAAINAILATEEIAQACNVQLPRMDMVSYPLPTGVDSSAALYRQWLNEGWKYRGFNKLPPKERQLYIDRVKYESEIIVGKDYIDYFLLTADLVKYAKDNNIPAGPARGSAAASLVCFLMRITEVNPMLFPNLVFERFIDKTREDLPDIDLDFDDERRMQLWDYASAKYGRDHVGSIGTFTAYKSKNSLDDVARAFDIPSWEVDKVKDLLIDRSSGDLRASATIEDTVEMFDEAKKVFERHPELNYAMALEGNIKGMGVHPAGLVISPRPIAEMCAIYERVVAGELRTAIAYDKYDAERMGLLKIDVLGLSTMGLLRVAIEELGMPLDDLYALSLDDPKVIQGFKDNDVVGIFQFDGRAMRSVNAQIQPENFDEICAVNALARPGPLHNNATAFYVAVKKGDMESDLSHPMLEDITDHTYGQVVYQEQILRIVMEIGNFEWTHAAHIRRIMSKKLGEQEFNRQWDRFVKGAMDNGLDEATAKDIWGQCITAGAYAFNLAHCVSYGMLAYWTMWLKVYHPETFFAAALTKLNEKKHTQLLRDAVKHNIVPVAPDPKLSGIGWRPGDGVIYSGLTQIVGVGAKTAQDMMTYRAEHEVTKWSDYLVVSGIGPKTIEKIEEFCASPDPFGVDLLRNKINEVRKMLDEGTLIDSKGQVLPRPTHTSTDIPETRGKDLQVVWLGVVTHRNLRELFEHNFSRTGVPLDPDTVRDPHLNEWVLFRMEDDLEFAEATIDRWRYPAMKEAVWNMKLGKDLVLLRGVKKGYLSWRMITVSDMWVLGD